MSSSNGALSTTVVPLERFRKAQELKEAHKRASGLTVDPPVPQPLYRFPGAGEEYRSRAESTRNVRQLIARLRSLSRGLAGDPELFEKMRTLLDAAEGLFCKLPHNENFWNSLDELALALTGLKINRLEQAEHLKHVESAVHGAASVILGQFGGKR